MKSSTAIVDLIHDAGVDDAAVVEDVRNRVGGRPAGRHESLRNRLSKQLAEQALREGRSPLHVMLENLQWFRDKAREIEDELRDVPTNPTRAERADYNRKMKALILLRTLADESAARAAPFCHPKINSITVQNEGGGQTLIVLAPGEERL